MKKFWDLETLGISESSESIAKIFTERFTEEHIVKRNERYEVSLPWKDTNEKLHDNFSGALTRLKKLVSRLLKDSKLSEYDKAIRNYMESDCAEEAPMEPNAMKTYYMPHHPVIREDKTTTKLRVYSTLQLTSTVSHH